MRKLKIISKGSPETTKVIDLATGEEIDGVQNVVIDIDIHKAFITTKMNIVDVEVDVEAEVSENSL